MLHDGKEKIEERDGFEPEYGTKNGNKFRIETFPFKIVSVQSEPRLGGGYIVEVSQNESKDSKLLSAKYGFEDKLYTVEKGTKGEIRGKMRQIALLRAKIDLEKGEFGEGHEFGSNTALDEVISGLTAEFEKAREKRIGF